MIAPILFATVLGFSSSLAFAQGAPASPPQGQRAEVAPACQVFKKLPKVDEVLKQVDATATEATNTDGAATELGDSCNAFMSSRQGRGREVFTAAQSKMRTQDQKYKGETDKLRQQVNALQKPMETLGMTQCFGEIRREHFSNVTKQANIGVKVGRSCNVGKLDERANTAALQMTTADEMSGTLSRDPKAVQEALLRPDQNRDLASSLNTEANQFGQKYGLSAGNPPCGEKCSSILAAKYAVDTYGADSPEAQRALAAAKASQLGRFGRSPLTSR